MLKMKIKDIHKCYKSVLNNFFVRCLQVVEKITSFFFEFWRQKRPYRAILREKIVKFFFRILFYGSWATIKRLIMFILRKSEPPSKIGLKMSVFFTFSTFLTDFLGDTKKIFFFFYSYGIGELWYKICSRWHQYFWGLVNMVLLLYQLQI